MTDPEPFGSRIGVYTDCASLPIALDTAADRGNQIATDYRIAVIVRDQSDTEQIRDIVSGVERTMPIIVDPGRWRRVAGRPGRPLDLPVDGLIPTSLAQWSDSYRQATGADAVFTPTLFVAAGEWRTLSSLIKSFVSGLDPTDRTVPLVATDASMLNPGNLARFLNTLAPVQNRRVAFVFAGGREIFAHCDRSAGLRAVLHQHQGAWILGVDGLIASDALSDNAGMVGIGVRSGMRWPAAPGNDSNAGFAMQGIPGVFNRDLFAYRSPPVYAHWYYDLVPAACSVCGRPPHRYNPSPQDKDAITAHNVHAAAYLCATLLRIPHNERRAWLQTERIEAATLHRELRSAQADKTLIALINRDNPGWRMPAPIGL
ncbi:hypothetical protein [Mycobacteroides abscessus]|uniref:hypothetical protein n=1 Tax=Mycobacteroides abscessus TaxID=36809 RepID=UPI0003092DE1|nr:hypothetical protein [Mycobacteroides abscessus]